MFRGKSHGWLGRSPAGGWGEDDIRASLNKSGTLRVTSPKSRWPLELSCDWPHRQNPAPGRPSYSPFTRPNWCPMQNWKARGEYTFPESNGVLFAHQTEVAVDFSLASIIELLDRVRPGRGHSRLRPRRLSANA